MGMGMGRSAPSSPVATGRQSASPAAGSHARKGGGEGVFGSPSSYADGRGDDEDRHHATLRLLSEGLNPSRLSRPEDNVLVLKLGGTVEDDLEHGTAVFHPDET